MPTYSSNVATNWRWAIRHVQWLFLKGQQKLAISHCMLYLSQVHVEPFGMYATYLNFYAAIASESLARFAHPSSGARAENLEKARRFYRAAMRTLPAPVVLYDVDEPDDIESTLADVAFESAGSDDTSNDNRDGSVRARTCYSPSSLQSDSYIADTLFPKPPSVHTPVSATFQESLSPSQETFGNLSPLRTATPRDVDDTPHPINFQARQQSLAYTSIWLRHRSAELYNVHLANFEMLLSRHLETIESLISATREAQTSGHTVRRLASYGDDEEAKGVDLRCRIQRLKAAGWTRDRFNPSRYEDLCEQALADL